MNNHHYEPAGLKDGMPPMHPGEMLLDELEYLEIDPADFALMLDVAPELLQEVLEGKRDVDGEMALRISQCLGTTPQLWMNLQSAYEIRSAEVTLGDKIRSSIKPLEDAAIKT